MTWSTEMKYNTIFTYDTYTYDIYLLARRPRWHEDTNGKRFSKF